MSIQTFDMPFDVALPSSRVVTAGKLKCLYEEGALRYICYGKVEVIRMIYSAVRDKNWETAIIKIQDEEVEVNEESFSIRYTAVYHLGEINYKAEFEIAGEQNRISVSTKGVALTSFNTNRVGICVLHPLKECTGKKVVITKPEGGSYESYFPVDISPHQPFKEVKGIQWSPGEGLEAQLTFEGDIFETEDQRNWTDASYKTYSRPLDLPFPYMMNAGETTKQKITLQISPKAESTNFTSTVRSAETKIPFPEIGYSRLRGSGLLTEKEIRLLKQVPFDHYRVEVIMNDPGWMEELSKGFAEARGLNTKVSLVVFFTLQFESEVQMLAEQLNSQDQYLSAMLVLQAGIAVTPDSLSTYVYKYIKQSLPLVEIGCGTDAYFVELNRKRPQGDDYDFISYSIQPQVHASDTRTILENLEAQPETIKTAKGFIGDKSIHISPVTIKKRDHCEAINISKQQWEILNTTDPRQHTWFAAHWTLQAIKSLSEAGRITFYEAVGPAGILTESLFADGKDEPDELVMTPVYKVLKAIKAFQPTWIIRQNINTGNKETLTLQNKVGDVLNFVTELPFK